MAWSKPGSVTADFVKQVVNFKHDKYLIDTDNQPKHEKEIAIGKDFSYYLSDFQNLSNTPVFNSYTIDNLPDEFNLTSLAIEMDDGKDVTDWFKSNDLASIISLKFTDSSNNDKEEWLTLKDIGVATNGTKLEGIDEKLAAYLKTNTNLKFARKVKFEFKEEIAVNESLAGRIVVTGNGKYLLDYKNSLTTSYNKKYWNPYEDVDNNLKEGYIEEPKEATNEASAVAKSMHADPEMTGYGVVHDVDNGTNVVNSNKNDNNEDCQKVALADPNVAIRFSLGNNKESYMIPAEFSATDFLKLKNNTSNTYVGLEASSVYLSPNLVSNSKIKTITFVDVTGTKIEAKYSEISKYLDATTGALEIPATFWKNYDKANKKNNVTKLKGIQIDFEEFKGNIQNTKTDDGAYVEINGTPNATGEYRFDGNFTTKYKDYDGLKGSNVNEDSDTGTAILIVQRIEPTIDASVHYGNTSVSADATNPLPTLEVPNKSSQVDPNNRTYYQFKIGNKSESSAQNVNLTFDLLSVGNVNKDVSKETIKGFDTEEFVIENGYADAMDIEKIEFFDYDQDASKSDVEPKWSISAANLTKDANGNIVIKKSDYKSKITRVSSIRIVTSKFNRSIINDEDKVVVKIYGNTDAYNKYYDSGKLEASLFFEPVGPLYSDEDTLKKSAAFSVVAHHLDIDNAVYQKNVTSEVVENTGNTDKTEKTLGIPYSRDFTYRVASWNNGISVLDDVKTVIDVPTEGTDGGFHATAIRVYKDLLDQYKGFDDKNTFDRIVIKQKSSLVTALFVNQETTITYKNGVLKNGENTYELQKGKYYDIPLEDVVSDGNQLESITLYGTNFVISNDQNIKPYVEIDGWSDAAINEKILLKQHQHII